MAAAEVFKADAIADSYAGMRGLDSALCRRALLEAIARNIETTPREVLTEALAEASYLLGERADGPHDPAAPPRAAPLTARFHGH